MTTKELIKEILKEKYDVKNLRVVVRLNSGELVRAESVDKYDDMVVIHAGELLKEGE